MFKLNLLLFKQKTQALICSHNKFVLRGSIANAEPKELLPPVLAQIESSLADNDELKKAISHCC